MPFPPLEALHLNFKLRIDKAFFSRHQTKKSMFCFSFFVDKYHPQSQVL